MSYMGYWSHGPEVRSETGVICSIESKSTLMTCIKFLLIYIKLWTADAGARLAAARSISPLHSSKCNI